MIPKKIHYCWFSGDEFPDDIKKCIESWRKYLPDYEIIEWNAKNFDFNVNQYVKEAYEAKNGLLFQIMQDYIFYIMKVEYI